MHKIATCVIGFLERGVCAKGSANDKTCVHVMDEASGSLVSSTDSHKEQWVSGKELCQIASYFYHSEICCFAISDFNNPLRMGVYFGHQNVKTKILKNFACSSKPLNILKLLRQAF
jgi:hypothetical protein